MRQFDVYGNCIALLPAILSLYPAEVRCSLNILFSSCRLRSIMSGFCLLVSLGATTLAMSQHTRTLQD